MSSTTCLQAWRSLEAVVERFIYDCIVWYLLSVSSNLMHMACQSLHSVMTSWNLSWFTFAANMIYFYWSLFQFSCNGLCYVIQILISIFFLSSFCLSYKTFKSMNLIFAHIQESLWSVTFLLNLPLLCFSSIHMLPIPLSILS